MGSDADRLGLAASLDRDCDLSSGWEAAVGAGGVSGAQRRGADPPRLSRQPSVQSPDALVATDPSAALGAADADDHRRRLSCGESRDVGAGHRLDGGAAHGGALVCPRDEGCFCPVLTLQKLRYELFSDHASEGTRVDCKSSEGQKRSKVSRRMNEDQDW